MSKIWKIERNLNQMKRQGIYAIMHLFVIRLFKRTQFFQNVFLNRYNFLTCMWVFNIGTQNLFCKHYFPYGLSISFKLFWKLFHTILASYTKVIFEIFEIVMYLSKNFCFLADSEKSCRVHFEENFRYYFSCILR